MFADEIRRAIEAASRITLPQVTALLWRAYGEGTVTEAEAEALSGLIEARTDAPAARRFSPVEPAVFNQSNRPPTQSRAVAPRRAVGSRPRTDTSLERRRRWAASGRLPPGLAARFTLAEQAVLALVAAETTRRKDCRLSIENLAAVAGVCRSTVKNAIREARQLGLLTVEERAITGFRNDTNIVRIVSAEWLAWLRLARRSDLIPAWKGQGAASPQQGGGVKSVTSTPTEVLILSESGETEPLRSCRRAAGDLDQATPPRIRVGGETARAMR
ncbi:hypothetical protein [Methylobacterium radiotolerans]|uniref:Helix-turn-helix domain-containing protein n=1 Tax=Methylobacterium radiotolerans (strain ATCC 27329 / DSM 1819 / JCM 2831 / NBRC 15690 / NCIMB 10815 / 0-1) TaxID=426355 RepID=B1M9V9_METRJ|nr:hypothetical protein [Methylobacterium radiotolerans]ACB28284.1 hypothetical protein Mrad2831_6362 [Methylobacterium radiotolerans JCM 2831]GEN01279.1 hypothetical protein MRA01_58180 [Methylobacterium radiotolerans]